jgi:xanthine dehydrogenase accessory factor
VKGAGDLATGVALSLHRAGFAVVMTEIPQPLAIRLSVAFAQAVYQGSHVVEGVRALRTDPQGWRAVVERGEVAVLVDPQAAILDAAQPLVVVDAIMAKRNTGTARSAGSIVIGLGPGFAAGADVDAVVETQRGHELGRIIREGSARKDSGMPGEIGGRGSDRVLRAPVDGTVVNLKQIGSLVKEGEPVARVGDQLVTAPFDGCLRGLIHDGIAVTRGIKIGDVDPRGQTQYAASVSDKARALGRAVLEAVLLIGRERGLVALAVGATTA